MPLLATLDDDALRCVVDAATLDFETACALQSTCRATSRIVYDILHRRQARFVARHNVWVTLRAPLTSVGARHARSCRVDVFLTATSAQSVENILLPVKRAWHVLTCTPVLRVANGFLWVRDTKATLPWLSEVGPGFQAMLVLETPLQRTILPYKCQWCGRLAEAGAASFAALVSKHRHHRSKAQFYANVSVVDDAP